MEHPCSLPDDIEAAIATFLRNNPAGRIELDAKDHVIRGARFSYYVPAVSTQEGSHERPPERRGR
jgi:hypothetical protein